MKRLCRLVLLIGSMFSWSVLANTGVALVHGTGHQTNAYHDYWQSGFVESVRKGLNNSSNLLVVNCNFEKYMWDSAASGCLASQLYQFIVNKNITDLVVITHSNGANVMRWILSNPTWDTRYPTIISSVRRVNAVAASSAGTPLADAVMQGNVFESALGWLLGYKTDAVRQQQVSWMNHYNNSWLLGTSGRPSLPKAFRSVVGTDVETAFWDSDSYCGGYALNLGLEITQNWLNSCSDGFIDCSSQRAAGSLWFYDKNKTKGREPLSHNQSRRKCFNLDKILRDNI